MSQLGLGTVQFGMHYGVANNGHKPDISAVQSILKQARNNNINMIDTALLYGDSETVLGECGVDDFNVITKTPRFYSEKNSTNSAAAVIDGCCESLQKLKLKSLYGLLAHNGNDLLSKNGDSIWDAMLQLKHRKQVTKIGVSVYTVDELTEILRRYPIELVQIPMNVFDQRMLQSGMLNTLIEKGVEIHVRSIFLQGLLLMKTPPAYFDPISSLLKQWHEQVAAHQLTALQAALIFIRDIPQVSHMIIGVTDVDQLNDAITAMAMPATFSAAGLSCDDTAFIDPSQWRLE